MAACFRRVAFYYRREIPKAIEWKRKITRWVKKYYPGCRILGSNVAPQNRNQAPQLLLVLGGDGTILEAVKKYWKWNPLVVGFNLGHVGFLTSAREEEDFLPALSRIFRGDYHTLRRMMLKAAVYRSGRRIFSNHALNDVAIQNLLGMVDLSVSIDGQPVQKIRGSGVLVATATGSTAFNLSAHGPIVMPDIKCLIITELFDHSIPSPSVVIKWDRMITVIVEHFRKKGKIVLRETGKPAEVVLTSDAATVIALEEGDEIVVQRSRSLIRFAELERDHFFKSIREKLFFS